MVYVLLRIYVYKFFAFFYCSLPPVTTQCVVSELEGLGQCGVCVVTYIYTSLFLLLSSTCDHTVCGVSAAKICAFDQYVVYCMKNSTFFPLPSDHTVCGVRVGRVGAAALGSHVCCQEVPTEKLWPP